MQVAVIGLWHLGSVSAACFANAGHQVIAYDPNQEIIAKLQQGQAPLFEPDLDNLLKKSLSAGHLLFSSNPQDLSGAEMVCITFDTPVDDQDRGDIEWVTRRVEAIFPYLSDEALVLIFSQVPVGTTRQWLTFCNLKWPHKKISFAVSPENLRLGHAIDAFNHPDRIIVGIDADHLAKNKQRIRNLFNSFTKNILWMSIESAEMSKHALNAFLATSVVFINELATLCERVGADASEVERGLKSEERIGPKAYLRPGNAIAGGTLARDVNYLIQIGEQQQLTTPLFSALLASNQQHNQWYCRRIIEILKNLQNKTIATLGLVYKRGTDTLRRSSAVETCRWLSEQGANVVAYDPQITHLPDELRNFIELKSSVEQALNGADAVVITTESPQWSVLTADQLLACVNQALVFDAGGFLMKVLGADKRIQYYSVGNTTKYMVNSYT